MKMTLKPLSYKGIDHIDVEAKCEIHDALHMKPVTTVTAVGAGITVGQIIEELSQWGVERGYIERRDNDKPKKVILNEPATVVLWDDGTKTIAKCDEDDSFDPLFGIIACVIRKLGRNRVKVNSWGWVIEFLADNMMDQDECRFLSDVLAVVADAWDLDGVSEAMERCDGGVHDGGGDE